MKFANTLKGKLVELPECEDLFQCYKQLKKKLKAAPVISTTGSNCSDHKCISGIDSKKELIDDLKDTPCMDSGASTPDELEADFLSILRLKVEGFNQRFLEAEETQVIHMRELTDEYSKASDVDSLKRVYKSYIDLHGDMLLLMNWSMLAYTSVVKILKKYTKFAGHKIHAPELGGLLAQPFCSTEAIAVHIQKCAEQVGLIKLKIEGLGGCILDMSTELPETLRLEGNVSSRKMTSEDTGQESEHKQQKALQSPDKRKRPRTSPSGDGAAFETGMCKKAQAAMLTWNTIQKPRSPAMSPS